MRAIRRRPLVKRGASRLPIVFRKPLAVAWLLLFAGSSWAGESRSIQEGFLDVTAAMGLDGMGGGEAAWGDLDNDGWVDLCAGGQVWRNERGKSFVKTADRRSRGRSRAPSGRETRTISPCISDWESVGMTWSWRSDGPTERGRW